MIDIFDTSDSFLDTPKLYIADIVIEATVFSKAGKKLYVDVIRLEKYPVILKAMNIVNKDAFFKGVHNEFSVRGTVDNVEYNVKEIKNIKFSSLIMYKIDDN